MKIEEREICQREDIFPSTETFACRNHNNFVFCFKSFLGRYIKTSGEASRSFPGPSHMMVTDSDEAVSGIKNGELFERIVNAVNKVNRE